MKTKDSKQKRTYSDILEVSNDNLRASFLAYLSKARSRRGRLSASTVEAMTNAIDSRIVKSTVTELLGSKSLFEDIDEIFDIRDVEMARSLHTALLRNPLNRRSPNRRWPSAVAGRYVKFLLSLAEGKAYAGVKVRKKKVVLNPATNMVVTFPDGTLIARYNASDTFTDAVRHIGAEAFMRAASELGMNGVAYKSRRGVRRAHSLKMVVPGCFVQTGSSTVAKRDVLLTVGHHLGVALSVDIAKKPEKEAANDDPVDANQPSLLGNA